MRGRVLSIRSFGKLTFIDVKDSTGKIQLLASKDDLDEKLEEHIELMDVGDIVGTSGSIMKTKRRAFIKNFQFNSFEQIFKNTS